MPWFCDNSYKSEVKNMGLAYSLICFVLLDIGINIGDLELVSWE